jgi:hypothetical protein
MEHFEGLNFRMFEEKDVDLFTLMFKKAFDKDSQIHLGKNSALPIYLLEKIMKNKK